MYGSMDQQRSIQFIRLAKIQHGSIGLAERNSQDHGY